MANGPAKGVASYQDKPLISQGISKPTAEATTTKPTQQSHFERDSEAYKALRVITVASGKKAPKPDFDPVECQKISPLYEGSTLPEGHPAQAFLASVIETMGRAVATINLVPHSEGFKETAINKIYVKNRDTLAAMRSVKVFYKTGPLIRKNFDNIAKKDGPLNILYPGAGFHAGSLTLAMSLIEDGTAAVNMTMTDIDNETPGKMEKVIKEWAKFNSDIKWMGKDESGAPKKIVLEITYKDKPVRIVYAIGDSPNGLYFKPADLKSADIVIVHDMGEGSDLPMLEQILPLIDRNGEPKAIVITNDIDAAPYRTSDMFSVGFLFSALPARGVRIDGSFGCAYAWPAKYAKQTGELGESRHKSAMLVSTNAPIFRTLGSDTDIQMFFAFSMLAGGRMKLSIHGEMENRRATEVKFKELPASPEKQDILGWVESKIERLGKEDAEFLTLIAMRYIAKDKPEIKSERLKAKIGDLLIKYEFIDPSNAEEFVKNSDQPERLYDFSEEDYKKIDQILLKMQTL